MNKILAKQTDPELVVAVLNKIEKDLDDLKAMTAERRLSGDQRTALEAEARQYEGQKVTITCILGDGEGANFSADLAEVLRTSGWAGLKGSGFSQSAFTTNPSGLIIVVSKADVIGQKVPAAAIFLDKVLTQLGFSPQRRIAEELPESVIQIIVGRRIPTK